MKPDVQQNPAHDSQRGWVNSSGHHWYSHHVSPEGPTDEFTRVFCCYKNTRLQCIQGKNEKKLFAPKMSIKNLTLDIRLKHPNFKFSKEFNSSLKLTAISKVIKFICYYANIYVLYNSIRVYTITRIIIFQKYLSTKINCIDMSSTRHLYVFKTYLVSFLYILYFNFK